MTLRSKVIIILASLFLIYGVISFFIQHLIIFPGFQSLENEQAKRNSNRAAQAIYREIHHLDLLCFDWAAWDDTYKFMDSPSKEYIDANLIITVFTGNRLNLIYFCDTKGKVVWGEIHDFNTEKPIQLPGFPGDAIEQNHPLLNFGTKPLSEKSNKGIIMTDKGPMLVASRPVLNSNFKGPVRGTVIMGRLLDKSTIETLINQTEVNFTAFAVQNGDLTVENKEILSSFTDKTKHVFKTYDHDIEHLHVYTTLSDISGNPVLLLDSSMPTEITQKGKSTMRYVRYSIILSSLIVMSAVVLLVQWIILSPTTKLTDHALAVAETGDLTKRISMNRKDEIGILSDKFDMMLEQLAEARNKLIEQSYNSGLAEMAKELMHNARNILTPMVGQISFMQKELTDLPFNNIAKAASELETGMRDTKRKESLVRYLILGSRKMLSITERTKGSLEIISNNIVQIENILAEQDKLSHSKKILEQLYLIDIFKSALTKVSKKYQEKIQIQIDKNISELPAILAERTVLTPVLTNLLNNAFESILKTRRNDGIINIAGKIEKKENGIKMVHINIKDNGQGLAKENLERIFQRDFSKKSRLSGVGLHWCANIISSMDGKLYAKTNNSSQGACFHLLLPMQNINKTT